MYRGPSPSCARVEREQPDPWVAAAGTDLFVSRSSGRAGGHPLRVWIAGCGWLVVIATGCGAGSAGSEATVGLPWCSPGQASDCLCTDGTTPGLAGCAPSGAGANGNVTTGGGMGNAGAAPVMMTMTPPGGSAGGMAPMWDAGIPDAGSGAAGAGPTGTGGAMAGMGGAGQGGSGGTGMAGDAGTSDAGSGGMGATDCGQGGMIGTASNAGGSQGRGYASVQFTLSAGNQISSLRTTLETPVKANGNSTLFVWPGLEPLQGQNYAPIGTGVLQPVLTWGGSCAPGSPQVGSVTNWWISAQYVNTLGSDPDYQGCKGGSVMNVGFGDPLLIEMSLSGTVWSQVVTDQVNGKSVDFDIDMMSQPQRWALFEIEMPTSTRPASDVVFTNTVLTFATPEPNACQPSSRGTNDYFSAPVASSDGLRCCVSRLVLRAQGVAATTQDPPP